MFKNSSSAEWFNRRVEQAAKSRRAGQTEPTVEGRHAAAVKVHKALDAIKRKSDPSA